METGCCEGRQIRHAAHPKWDVLWTCHACATRFGRDDVLCVKEFHTSALSDNSIYGSNFSHAG